MTEQYPRCLYARLGLDSEGMKQCSGFIPEEIGIISIHPWLVELGDVRGVTCGRLGVQESTRGFVSACLFEGAPLPVPPPTMVGPGHPVHHQPELLPHGA